MTAGQWGSICRSGMTWSPAMIRHTYDDQNIFAKILRGEIPSQRVYEDDAVVAFMDVMPQGNGHTLVVPRSPSRNILDADPATLGPLVQAVQRVAQAAMRAFDADGVTVIQFNEPVAGQSVFHLHFHVIPRFDGVPLKPHSGNMEDQAVLAANAEKLRKAIATDSPH
jgi:histidine triad (HIT) family protein